MRLALVVAAFVVIATACSLPQIEISADSEAELDDSAAAVGVTVPGLIALDGDSLEDANGISYRLIGINAPDPPECLADAARDRMRALVESGGGEVVLLDGEAEPTDQFGRSLVYAIKHTETADLALNVLMVEEGLAIAIHAGPNDQLHDRLFAAQERAQTGLVGVWSADGCGDGPLADVAITAVVANPPGPDDEVLDQETITVTNEGSISIELTGWIIRDESTQNRFSFPDGFVLAPRDSVTVDAGSGEFGFGSGSPIWNNSGDTAFLVDDDGRFVDYLTIKD